MANDTIEKSVPMMGGGANAFSQTSPVPVAQLLQSSSYFDAKEASWKAKQKLKQDMATFLAPSNRTRQV
jgi:hypothetical protein